MLKSENKKILYDFAIPWLCKLLLGNPSLLPSTSFPSFPSSVGCRCRRRRNREEEEEEEEEGGKSGPKKKEKTQPVRIRFHNWKERERGRKDQQQQQQHSPLLLLPRQHHLENWTGTEDLEEEEEDRKAPVPSAPCTEYSGPPPPSPPGLGPHVQGKKETQVEEV